MLLFSHLETSENLQLELHTAMERFQSAFEGVVDV